MNAVEYRAFLASATSRVNLLRYSIRAILSAAACSPASTACRLRNLAAWYADKPLVSSPSSMSSSRSSWFSSRNFSDAVNRASLVSLSALASSRSNLASASAASRAAKTPFL